MKNIKFLLTAALATTLFSCVNTDNYGAPDLSGKCTDLPVTKQVAAVKRWLPLQHNNILMMM